MTIPQKSRKSSRKLAKLADIRYLVVAQASLTIRSKFLGQRAHNAIEGLKRLGPWERQRSCTDPHAITTESNLKPDPPILGFGAIKHVKGQQSKVSFKQDMEEENDQKARNPKK